MIVGDSIFRSLRLQLRLRLKRIFCSFPDHEWQSEEEEELTDLVSRHEVRQLLRLDPELPLHRRQRRRQVRVAHTL